MGTKDEDIPTESTPGLKDSRVPSETVSSQTNPDASKTTGKASTVTATLESKESEPEKGIATEKEGNGTFVNQGLQQWEVARASWLHHNKSDTDSTSRVAAPLDVDEIIDVIFSPRWRTQGEEDGPPRRFPQNVPLPQMVDILVDLWEAEGLDT